MRTLIRGGTVVNSGGGFAADVLVDGETIAAVAAPGLFTEADRVIDAAGKYVLPGGIDAHTHMEMPFGGTSSSDTFGTGTVSDDRILKAVLKVFSFKPADIVQQLNLLRPIYRKTTNYGHFGKNDKDLTWEVTNKADALLKAVR